MRIALPCIDVETRLKWVAGRSTEDQEIAAGTAPFSNTIFEEFLLPRCGATFDENSVPPWKGGTSGGF